MKTTRMKIEPTKMAGQTIGRINPTQVDATTEAQITVQMAQDEALAMQDAAKFARRVRRRLGFSQAEFATRIDVSLETIRNWEQGKRSPTGAAKALLKVLDRAPEAALAAFGAAPYIFPDKKIHMQYTTTSPKLHKILGVDSPVFD